MKRENTPTIETERIILRKFKSSDVADILALYGDEQVNTFLPWYPIATKEEAEEYLKATIMPQYDKDIAYTYAIELKGSGKMVGYIHIHDIGAANDIGYAISKELWGKGLAAEGCKAIISHLRDVGFPYLTATHDINNPNSGSVMQKCGMTYKYTYREKWQPKDVLVYFRMYQLNLDGNEDRLYTQYWDKYPNHFIEKL